MRSGPAGQYPRPVTEPRTVALLTLGCARNDVDSDELAATLTRAGFTVVNDVGDDNGHDNGHGDGGGHVEPDVVVVNTCGFVAQAKAESIATLLEAAGDGRPVVAVGCMAERYGRELAAELPEAAAVVGFDGYVTIADTLSRVISGEPVESHDPFDRRTLLPLTPVERPGLTQPPGHGPVLDLPGSKRLRLRRGPVAPVKIASGCDRRCSFCAIPRFRGSFVSRSPGDILAESAWLVADEGVREIVLVSENSTSYGKDLGDPRLLESLLPQFASLPGLARVRVSYLQPAEMRPTLLHAMTDTEIVAPYFDLSFQHASGPLLRRMRRFGDIDSFLGLIAAIRERSPQAGIRSNVIVGFPGETETDVEILEEFLSAAELDAVGVFAYSDEDDTEAVELPDHIDPDEISARVDRVAALAEVVSAQRAADRVGSTQRLVVERSQRTRAVGRLGFQGPEDGETSVVVQGSTPGDAFDVRVVASQGVDLVAEVIS